MTPIPFSCRPCREKGSPHGVLVWPDPDGTYPPMECKYHAKPFPVMERSPYYDAQGNRIKKETHV